MRVAAPRAALMDALRPKVEWALGAPVQFVVYDLRRQGDLAFASVYPQRPGGADIDLGKWMSGQYAVPSQREADAEEVETALEEEARKLH